MADGELQNFRGQLAKNYTVSADGLTISFTMNDDIYWHDGSPITAQDVKFTWELLQRSLLSMYCSVASSNDCWYADFSTKKANELSGIIVNGNTVTFKFSSIFQMLSSLSHNFPLPQKYLGTGIIADTTSLLLAESYRFWSI